MKARSVLLLITLIALPVSLVLFCGPAMAGETGTQASTPSEAKQAFEQMSPEEKEAMKEQAQEKRSAWQQLSEEEKLAKKQQAKDKAGARRSDWQHMSAEEKQARRGVARERARQARGSRRQ